MTNQQIAAVFREIADLLIREKENWFKVRAYRKVADEIEKLSVDVSELVKENRLGEIPGAGEAIKKKIEEMIETGNLQYLQRLKTEVGGEVGKQSGR